MAYQQAISIAATLRARAAFAPSAAAQSATKLAQTIIVELAEGS